MQYKPATGHEIIDVLETYRALLLALIAQNGDIIEVPLEIFKTKYANVLSIRPDLLKDTYILESVERTPEYIDGVTYIGVEDA